MCNPMAIGAVMLVAGTAMKYRADQQREADMRKVQRRETERQDRYYAEAAGNLSKNRDSYTRQNVEQKMADAAAERQAQYNMAEAVAPRANEAPAGANGGNQVINDVFSRILSDAKGQAANQGARRAELASFGDTMGENAIENNRRSGEIGMLGSFSKGSSAVMPIELQHEMSRGRPLSTIGGMMQAFGGAMMGGAGAAAAGAGAGAGGMAAGGAMSGAAGGMGAAAGGAMSGIDWSSLYGARH